MSLNKKLVITKMEVCASPCIVMALLEDDTIMELQVHPVDEAAILGNIYVGKVNKIVQDRGGAFVDIKPGFSCYLSLDESADKNIKNGSEVLVQVSQEALKSKVPRVTTNLNLAGKYLVVTSEKPGLGISSKLDAKRKKELKEWVAPYLDERYGIIVRTNAGFAKKEEIIAEMSALTQRMEKIQEKGKTRTCYSLIEKSMPFYLHTLRNISSHELEKIVTDIPGVYREINEFLNDYQRENPGNLQLYEDAMLPLYKLYSLERAIEEATHEKVWLKSGGFLMIQQTEAFAAIDVNSGKYSSKKNTSDTYFKINLEAAKEIARQLRLRNLYGIILIDFINMERVSDREALLRQLSDHLKTDSIKAKVIDMTKLQITEVTRKKTRKSLYEQINELKTVRRTQ